VTPSPLIDRAEFDSFIGGRIASDGFVVLGHIDPETVGPDGKKKRGVQHCQRFTDVDSARAWAEGWNAQGRGIYIVNNPPKPDWTPDKASDQRGGGDPPSHEDIPHRRRYQLDADPNDALKKELGTSKERDAEILSSVKAEALGLLEQFEAEAASMVAAIPEDQRPPGIIRARDVVDSGRGIHVHFELDPFGIASELTTAINERLIAWFRTRSKLCKFDGVANVARVMRCPGATNPRTGEVARIIRHEPESAASAALWSLVLPDKPLALAEPRGPDEPSAVTVNVAGFSNKTVREVVEQFKDRLDIAKVAKLRRLCGRGVTWAKIDKTLTPEGLCLSSRVTMMARYCVTKPEDVVVSPEGVAQRKPDCGYSDSEPLLAVAGQMLREGAKIGEVLGVLANPDLGVSRHVYKGENERGYMRAILRTVAKAICLEESPDSPVLAVPEGFVGLSEDHIAHVGANAVADRFRWVQPWKRWMIYRQDQGRWTPDDTLTADHHFRAVCREAAKAVDAGGLASSKTVTAVEHLARSDRRLSATVDQWDTDPYILNTPGGVVDLRTGEVRAHDPLLYLTKMAGVAPADPGTPCPEFDAWFLWAVPDADTREHILRYCGYCLSGDVSEHTFVFMHGLGGNGKSTLGLLMRGILGDYATSTPAETLMVTGAERHPTDLADLHGKRLVTFSEVEDGARWAEAKIKMMTGGTKIKARRMREDFWEYEPQFKLLGDGNHKPAFTNVGPAIRRRLKLWPFTASLPVDERGELIADPRLPEKLLAEGPAILRKLIEAGIRRLSAEGGGLMPSALVRGQTAEYLDEQDHVARWFDSCCEADVNGEAAIKDLYQSWAEWCDARGHKAMDARWLSSRLMERPGTDRCKIGKDRERGLSGLRLTLGEATRLERKRAEREAAFNAQQVLLRTVAEREAGEGQQGRANGHAGGLFPERGQQ
jgi:P4 family phage/plasmid primase-like protien